MKKLTRTEARKAAGWFRQVFGLEDWSVDVCLDGDLPKWAGDPDDGAAIQVSVAGKRAEIWLSHERVVSNGEDPLEILFHECGHMWFRDIEAHGRESPGRMEFALLRLGEVCAFAYRRGMKP